MNIKKIKECIEKIVYELYYLSGHPHKLLSILNTSVSCNFIHLQHKCNFFWEIVNVINNKRDNEDAIN